MNGIRGRSLRGHGAEHAEGGGHRVAAALDGELDDVFRIEVIRVGRERGAGGVLDALVHRQDGEIAGAGEAAGVEHLLEVAQHAGFAVLDRDHAVNVVRAGQMEPGARDAFAGMVQQAVGLVAQERLNVRHRVSPSVETSFG